MYEGFGCGGCGFEDASEGDGCSVADTASDASRDMIDFAAGLCDASETCTVFKSFAGIDTHDGEGEFGL